MHEKKERKFFCAIIQSITNTRLRTEKQTPSTWFYLGITMAGNGALECWCVRAKDWTDGFKCPWAVWKAHYQRRRFKYDPVSKIG